MNNEEREINAYFEGLLEGLWRYAWMKDGVYYVGTTGKTLKEAQEEIKIERQKELNNVL